ncbi:hypothetical protein SAMN04487861_10812 [Selenomonas ruminantium]|uniref:Uncharacterized protein n=1 Tax=Selenomonas ruminantium TaxID=971 RepID=A0A1I3DV50_SELRU|nr:hypothetical protein [Selenomonas ruminantium]SFH90617.1 hypothetical protein SAMN04487861_10812 [Selenomonas ruminantium]
MLWRKFLGTIWLCTMMLLGSANMVQALGLSTDGQGGYYASDNHDYMLIDTQPMGPISMWYMLDLNSCESGSYDGRAAVYGRVYMITSDSENSKGGTNFNFVFFQNGVYHAPGGSYQYIKGSDTSRAAKVIFDRANGKSSSGSKSSSSKQHNLLRDDQIAIGGISPFGSSQAYIRSIYGEPTKISRSWSKSWEAMVERWEYGDSFIMLFVGDSTEYPYLIKCTAANGLATPDGIKVGSPASEVITKYGKPPFAVNGSYHYKGRGDCDFVFSVANGVVTAIYVGWSA